MIKLFNFLSSNNKKYYSKTHYLATYNYISNLN